LIDAVSFVAGKVQAYLKPESVGRQIADGTATARSCSGPTCGLNRLIGKSSAPKLQNGERLLSDENGANLSVPNQQQRCNPEPISANVEASGRGDNPKVSSNSAASSTSRQSQDLQNQ